MTKFNVNNLTTKQKLGQLIMFGFDALEVNDHAINLIKNHQVGNVILFSRNVKTTEQLFNLCQNLQKLAYESIGIPLFISIDQEGGMVTRIKNGGTYFPGAMTIAATNNVENAYLSGKYMGRELLALGINMNLAPVLDVNNNPKNPVIGVRSFSDNPEMVSEYGNKFIEGLQESIIATAKHFPGHGDTNTDSHLALPSIDYDIERLEKVELYPFNKAIKNGIKAIMSAHINFKAFTEDNLPTTLSKKCLTGLLREALKFEGLIVTDCMQMKAIQDNYTTSEGSLMAINAGANLLCISHSETLQLGALNRLNTAVESGEISQEVLDERVSRILKFKEELQLTSNSSYSDVIETIENEDTREFAYDVVKSGATLVKGKEVNSNLKTLLIAATPQATSIADEDDGEQDIAIKVSKEIPRFDTMKIDMCPNELEINRAIKLAEQYEQVIVCTYNSNIYSSQIELVKNLLDGLYELHIVAMRNPYDLLFIPKIPNYVCFYEYTPNSVNALIEYLKGNSKLLGKAPIQYE